MRTAEDVVALYKERQRTSDRRMSAARRVSEVYEGRTAIPLPEMDSYELSAIANTLQQGVDGTSQRIASTMPDPFYPAEKPNFKKSETDARMRRQATLGWWEMSAMELVLARRARHLITYATSPVLIRPSTDGRDVPVWEVRNPLGSFPAPPAHYDQMWPSDCIFATSHTLEWLKARYPGPVARLRVGRNPRPDMRFECLEYMDEDCWMMLVIGAAPDPYEMEGAVTGSAVVALEGPIPNRAGVCTAIVPGRIVLDNLIGQFDQLPGMHLKQARLDALEYIAITEGVFPKQWLVSNPGEQAQVVTVADGKQGILGEIRGGQIVTPTVNPSYLAYQAQDRLEAAQRQTGGVPAAMSGVAASNVRTGRATDALLGASVDFGVAEHQKILARSMSFENQAAVAVAKGYWGPKTVSFYVSAKGDKGQVTYQADKLFTSDRNTVKWSMAGTNQQELIIGLGQRLGVGLISKQTARRMDPMIEDYEVEDDLTTGEALNAALLSGIQQQVSTGQMSPDDVASIVLAVTTDAKSLAEAVMMVQRKAQEAQAAQQQAEPGSPETMPGLAVDAEAAAAQPAIAPPGPAQGNLAQLLNQVRGVRQAAAS